MPFQIIQWNLNGFYCRLEYLQQLIKEHQPEILCIQETNFKDEHIGKIKNYRAYAKNRVTNHASGGVATFIKSNIFSQEINITSNLEVIATKITSSRTFCVCNIYIPNSQPLDEQEILHIIEQLPEPFILVGDFNSHSPLWGSYKTDSRGLTMEAIIDNTNLVLLNTNEPTHFNIANGQFSAIDLSICSPGVAPNITWGTLTDLNDSDHFPIKILLHEISDNQIGAADKPQKWKFQKADWEKYEQEISKSLSAISCPNMINPDIINTTLNEFIDLIKKAANSSIPKTHNNNSNNARHAPWWNEDCAKAVRDSKQSFNRYKKHKTTENLINFKRHRAISRKVMKQSKRESWKTYLSKMSSNTPISEIWTKLRAIKGIKTQQIIPALVKDDKCITTNKLEIAELLATTFQTNSSNSNYTQSFITHKEATESHTSEIPSTTEEEPSTISLLNSPFKLKELLFYVNKCTNTSPGPDGIPNILIAKLPLEALNHLLHIFNSIWMHNVFPDA